MAYKARLLAATTVKGEGGLKRLSHVYCQTLAERAQAQVSGYSHGANPFSGYGSQK